MAASISTSAFAAPSTDAELTAEERARLAALLGNDDGEDDEEPEPEGSREERTTTVPRRVIYPYVTWRYGDFIEGSGCPEGWVRVEVITITVNGPNPGDREERLSDRVCYQWRDLEGEPQPPTMTPGFAGEMVEKYLPIPDFVMNPADYAVTGIETWVWYGDDGSLGLESIDHDGNPSTPARLGASVVATDPAGLYTVEARAWISEYRWDMGDGGTITSPRPGSEEDPAGEHLYSSTNPDNRVRASVTWRGSYTVNGVAPPNSTLPAITIQGAWEDYPIYQIRSVPVAPGRG